MARLSTHVLDTARGRPASKLAIDLYHGDILLKSVITNAGGRTEDPLLSGECLPTGVYQLIFHAGDYFRQLGLPLTDPPFLDRIIIQFGIADAQGEYHVPLLLSPYGYSTYRGS